MAKHKRNSDRRSAKQKPFSLQGKPADAEKSATLGDLLSSDMQMKLKEQAKQLKDEEEERREAERHEAAKARKAEKERLESSFEYLLDHIKVKNSKYE